MAFFHAAGHNLSPVSTCHLTQQFTVSIMGVLWLSGPLGTMNTLSYCIIPTRHEVLLFPIDELHILHEKIRNSCGGLSSRALWTLGPLVLCPVGLCSNPSMVSICTVPLKCQWPCFHLLVFLIMGRLQKKVVGIGILSASASLRKSLSLVLCARPLGDGLLRTECHTFPQLPALSTQCVTHTLTGQKVLKGSIGTNQS